MTDLAQQISDEHEKLVRTFTDSSYVTVSLSDGATSGKYEVEYKIKGAYRQEDGSIALCDSHRVAISLPFGYPKFPPICKPLTPIFHPDFDSAAICINDFWNTSKSLTGLITQIGRMIAGQVFGTENVFNSEAAKWYQENGDKLPFDVVNLEGNREDSGVEISPESSPLSLEGQETVELNLESHELPSLEDIEIPREENEHEEQNPFDERNRDGDGGQAFVSENEAIPEHSGQAEEVKETTGEPAQRDAEVKKGGIEPPSDLAASYEVEQRKKKKRSIGTLFFLFFFLLVLGGASFLFLDILNYKKAESAWLEAAPLLAQNQFKEVKARGDLALGKIEKIRLFRKNEAERIKKEIDLLFSSLEFQGRLQGKKLYDGVYVDEKTIPLRESLKTVMQKGEDALVAEKWDAAHLLFQEAQNLAKDIKLDDEASISAIEKYLAISRLNSLVDKGVGFFEKGSLDDAISTFQEAIELGKADNYTDAEQRAFISHSLDKSLLRKYIKEGEEAYTSIQLDKALNSFNQALLLAEKGTSSDSEYNAKEIRKYIQQIKLYALLEKGKKDYESSDWQSALLSFQEALNFIADDTFDKQELGVNEAALGRKILQTTIQIHEDLAARKKQEKDIRGAIEEYQIIVKSIRQSEFRDDDTFVEIAAKFGKEISSLEKGRDMEVKIAYLTENYLEIFQANHSLARSATLRYPVVAFVQQEGKVQQFNLKCTGYTGTGKISLELNYFYDLEKKSWSLSRG